MLRDMCQRCGNPMPYAHEGKMALSVLGVGSFHRDCQPTLHQRAWSWLYRHFGPKRLEGQRFCRVPELRMPTGYEEPFRGKLLKDVTGVWWGVGVTNWNRFI